MATTASATILLDTVIENTSGAARFFGFLGPHGMRLAVDAVIALPGDLVAQLGAIRSRRKYDALQKALVAGDLAIRSRPASIVYDPSVEDSKAILVHNGAVHVATPSYGDTDSEGLT